MRSLVPLLLLAACQSHGTVRHAPPSRHETGGPVDDTGVVDTQDTEDTEGTDLTNELGIDISHWQGTIDWHAVRASGVTFAYAKATQSTTYIDDKFTTNFAGMEAAGVFRGAYHFAQPDKSTAVAQAQYFVAHGGGWPDDGITLPGALDIEWNPYGDDCYGLTKSQMSTWIHDFVDEYESLTGRTPAIYCGKTWWSLCVGSGDFSDAPLWVSSWDDPAPYLPSGWTEWTIWQTGIETASGVSGDTDRDEFNGGIGDLQRFVDGN